MFEASSTSFHLQVVGGDSRDRTGDLLLARQALSQLSYIPVLSSILLCRPFAASAAFKRFACETLTGGRIHFARGFLSPQRAPVKALLLWEWWARVGSNHRPYDYQSYALAS